jgi:hypothetical protein
MRRRSRLVETRASWSDPGRQVGGARGDWGVLSSAASRAIPSNHRVGRGERSRSNARPVWPNWPNVFRHRSSRTSPQRTAPAICTIETPEITTLMSNSRATVHDRSERSFVTQSRARCCVNPGKQWPNGPVGQLSLRWGQPTAIAGVEEKSAGCRLKPRNH